MEFRGLNEIWKVKTLKHSKNSVSGSNYSSSYSYLMGEKIKQVGIKSLAQCCIAKWSWDLSPAVYFCLVSFIQHSDFEIQPCCRMY